MSQNIASLLLRSFTSSTRCGIHFTRRLACSAQEERQRVTQHATCITRHRRQYSADSLIFGQEAQEARMQHRACKTIHNKANVSQQDGAVERAAVDEQHEDAANFVELSKTTYNPELNDVAEQQSTQTLADFAELSDTEYGTMLSDPNENIPQVFSYFDDRFAELLDLDYVSTLPLALSRKEPDLATRCVFAARKANDTTFLASISTVDFSAILDLLKPSSFLNELIDIHYSMKDALVNNFALTPIKRVAEEFGDLMQQLIALRRSTATPLTLEDYETILAAAQELQLRDLADNAWSCLHSDGHQPSTKAYNGYIGATSRLGAISAISRHQDRKLPRRLQQRQADKLLGSLTFRVGFEGIATHGDRLFAEMRDCGLEPDEGSYCNIITAYALEGLIDDVSAVLRNIYGIDVGLVRASDDGQVEEPRMFAPGHPLRPTKRLLFAVTRAYCINNDLPTAVKLLDYLCRHHKIPADEAQWRLLLEWVCVLTSYPSPSARQIRDGVTEGSVPLSTMQALWQTMVSPPYNIVPTTTMLDLLIRSMRGQKQEDFDMLQAMNAGRAKFSEAVRERRETWLQLENLLLEDGTVSTNSDSSVEHATRAWELSKLKCTRDLNFLRTWVHYYLSASETFALFDFDNSKTAREIPNFLWRWHKYLPRVVHYSTPTGHVELLFRSPEMSKAHRDKQTRQTQRRLRRLQSVPRMIDGSWIANHDAADRVQATKWKYEEDRSKPGSHKRHRGKRRPIGW